MKKQVIGFRDERNWKRFHDPKNLSIALSIESAELQELFLWKSVDEIKGFISSNRGIDRVKEEIADICIYLLYLSDCLNIDLSDAVKEKLRVNRDRYPVSKSYNNSKKYSELDDE